MLVSTWHAAITSRYVRAQTACISYSTDKYHLFDASITVLKLFAILHPSAKSTESFCYLVCFFDWEQKFNNFFFFWIYMAWRKSRMKDKSMSTTFCRSCFQDRAICQACASQPLSFSISCLLSCSSHSSLKESLQQALSIKFYFSNIKRLWYSRIKLDRKFSLLWSINKLGMNS